MYDKVKSHLEQNLIVIEGNLRLTEGIRYYYNY